MCYFLSALFDLILHQKTLTFSYLSIVVLPRRPQLMRTSTEGPIENIHGHELVIELYKKAGFCEACNHLIVGKSENRNLISNI